MVSKGSKAALLVDFKSRKSSTLFLRKTLEEIYGAEQLSKMTAIGRLKDSLGISKPDLSAIYGKNYILLNITLQIVHFCGGN